MKPNFIRLNANRHRYLKLMEHQGFGYARSFGQSDLMLAEFSRAAVHYPIVFSEDESGTVRPVVLLSRDGESNAFVTHEGRWVNTYVPLVIRLHPFAIARLPERDSLVVCIDINSELLSHDIGVPLFDIHGDPAPALDHAMKQLNEIDAMLLATEDFCRVLKKLNLLAPLTLPDHGGMSIQGLDSFYAVDERALDQLGDAALCVLRNRGWLIPLYAHRMSLMQIHGLPELAPGHDWVSHHAYRSQPEGVHA